MALVLALTALVAACSVGGDDDGSTANTGTTVPTSPPDDPAPDADPGTGTSPGAGAAEAEADVDEQIVGLPGRLAVANQGQLAIVEPDGSDAEQLEDGVVARADQPTWSPDGAHLVWSRTTIDGHQLVFLDTTTDDEVTTDIAGPPAFYFQWTPDGSAVALLRNSPEGPAVELAVVSPGAPLAPLATAAPLYLSWAPGSQALAAHVDAGRITLFDGPAEADATGVAEAPAPLPEPLPLFEPTGRFTTPAWLSDTALLVAAPHGLVSLDIITGEASLLLETSDPVQFVLSPDRTKVAYRVHGLQSDFTLVAFRQSTAPAVAQPGLVVLDLATGESHQVAEPTVGVMAWEWSPDSTKLAWLEGDPNGLSRQARWSFWDGETSTPSFPYQMSRMVFVAYRPFFEQYTQSVTGWSPDSSAFAFAGKIPELSALSKVGLGSAAAGQPNEGPDAIWVQLVAVDAPPVPVAEGDVVTWGR